MISKLQNIAYSLGELLLRLYYEEKINEWQKFRKLACMYWSDLSFW